MSDRKKDVKQIMEERRQALIAATWPELAPGTTWDYNNKKSKGFATIPRCLPHFMDIMDELSNGSPLSAVYLTLWCHAFPDGFVQIKSEQDMAFEAGLKGQRGVATWRAKMNKLKSLGFILAEAGASGDYSYILLKNPYHVVKEIAQAPTATESIRKTYRVLADRANDVGAKDLL